MKCPPGTQLDVCAVLSLCLHFRAKDLLDILENIIDVPIYLARDQIASLFEPQFYLATETARLLPFGVCSGLFRVDGDTYAAFAITLACFLYPR